MRNSAGYLYVYKIIICITGITHQQQIWSKKLGDHIGFHFCQPGAMFFLLLVVLLE